MKKTIADLFPDDAINPSHYKDGDIECIDAIKSSLGDVQFKGYLKATIIKLSLIHI